MPDHPVKRTLERDVLPYIVSAQRLKKQWFYRLHSIFGYTTDVVVLFAAIGVSSPLFGLLASSGSAADPAKPPTFANVLASVPAILMYPVAVLIVTWVIIRVAFNREEGQKRAVLARSCTQILHQAEAGLPTALSSANPMPALTEMLEKRIRPTVDRNIQEESWPWSPYAPRIESDVKKEVTRLVALYESDWTPVKDPDLRELPTEEKKS